MSKEARALLKKINDKKNAIRGLQGQGKTQEMKDRMAELREMQEEFDMLMEMEEDDDDEIKDSLPAVAACVGWMMENFKKAPEGIKTQSADDVTAKITAEEEAIIEEMELFGI